MKNITITLDLKSICVGALGVLTIVSLSNFNKADEKRTDADGEVRRYQAVSSERGMVILDTKTGKYLLTPLMVGRVNWQKGDFNAIHTDESTKSVR